jgi:hypothetical protein
MAGTEHLESLEGNNLAELCSKSLYTLDGLWFTLLEKKYGFDVALDIDEEVWRRFCPIHIRRVLQTFPIKADNPIRTVVSLLKVDPVQLIYKLEIVELTDSKAVFRVTDCPPQKARIRGGRGEFPCKQVGTIMYKAYAEAIDPRIKLTCLVCPPDTHPSQYWCDWQFEI